MKRIILIASFLLGAFYAHAGLNLGSIRNMNTGSAITTDYSGTLNVGLGTGYNGYDGIPILAHYEALEAANSLTLGLFLGFGTSSYDFTYTVEENGETVLKEDSYRRSYIPVGIKGVYYIDDLLGLIDELDIYGGVSIGFTYWSYTSSNDQFDEDNFNSGTSPLFWTFHIGIEYHVNDKVGVFLDASTGMSSLGVSFKVK
ncbi:MAG: hypothetical protein GY827_08840 [Cytophagales bacterium]|nr:hypothetical protein [Cytophagales bacterium]